MEDPHLLRPRQLVEYTISLLPILSLKDATHEECGCPICLTPWEDVVDGITKLAGCGHLFCLPDLTEWINGFHGSCPTCRHPFEPLLRPPSDSDGESDDEDYFPENEDDDDDEMDDDFFDSDADGMTEGETMTDLDLEMDDDDGEFEVTNSSIYGDDNLSTFDFAESIAGLDDEVVVHELTGEDDGSSVAATDDLFEL